MAPSTRTSPCFTGSVLFPSRVEAARNWDTSSLPFTAPLTCMYTPADATGNARTS